MIGKIDHIGIAVRALDEAISVYDCILGREGPDRLEEVASEGVSVAFYELGESRIELLASSRADGPIDRFIEKRGPGVHHVCFAVEDIEGAVRDLSAKGLEFVGAAPRLGAGGHRVAFLHPRSTGGVLIELSEPGSANV